MTPQTRRQSLWSAAMLQPGFALPNDEGQDIIEYSLLTGLLAMAFLAGMNLISGGVFNTFGAVMAALSI